MAYSPGCKVVIGNDVIMDLTADTVTPEKLMSGETAHDKDGNVITGTFDMFALTVNELKALTTT